MKVVLFLLGALAAEDAELLRREDGLPLLLRLLHGPRRGRRRRHRHHGARQPPSGWAVGPRPRAREGEGGGAGGRRGGGGGGGAGEEGRERGEGPRGRVGVGGRHPQLEQMLDSAHFPFSFSQAAVAQVGKGSPFVFWS